MENTDNFMGLDPEKTAPAQTAPDSNNPGSTTAENVIIILAYVVLIAGIIGSLSYGIDLMDSRYTREMGARVLIGGSIFSIVSWAFLMVIARISINLRDIKLLLQHKYKTGE